jgi:hypothetical protein
MRRGMRFLWQLGFLNRMYIVCVSIVACDGSQEHPANYVEDGSDTTTQEVTDSCASPKEGCSCSEPGEIADCGQVTVMVEDYATCFMASRLCDATGTWSSCAPDSEIAERSRTVSVLARP